MTTRLAGLGAVLFVSAAALAGCGPMSSAPKAASSPTPKSPSEVLLAAVPTDKSGPYRFRVDDIDGKLAGVVDAPKKTVSIGITQKQADVPVTLDMRFLIIDARSWVKIKFTPAGLAGLPRIPAKWQLLDPSKIKDQADSPLAYGADQSDPGYTHEVIANAAQVRLTSAGHYRGVTDLSRTGVEDIVDNATVKALGERVKSVPFTAATDARGRLTRLDLRIPAAGKTKAHTYSTVYDGYDSAAAPGVPGAGEQQKAVPAVYDMLNS
jgi:hypothetical protein